VSQEDLPVNYAQALHALALGEWASWLKGARQRLSEDDALLALLADASASPAEKQRRVASLLPAEASPKFRQFLGLLVDKGHLGLLGEIAASFERLVERGGVGTVAHVTSAIELTEEEKAQLRESLRKRFGAGLDLEFSVDPSLLGGVKVRVGDTIIDGSVAGRLATLRERLVSS